MSALQCSCEVCVRDREMKKLREGGREGDHHYKLQQYLYRHIIIFPNRFVWMLIYTTQIGHQFTYHLP